MKIKERIKKYFTEKPKTSFWQKAFFYLLLFRYVAPISLIFFSFMLVGLATPNFDPGQTFNETSIKIAEIYTGLAEKMFSIGQNIAYEHPIFSKVLFFLLSNFVYVIWVGTIIIIFDLLRYFVSWIIRKKFVFQGRQEE